MENVNVAGEEIGSIPMKPIEDAEARVARTAATEAAEVAVNKIARVVTVVSNVVRNYISTLGSTGEVPNATAEETIDTITVDASTAETIDASLNGAFCKFRRAIAAEAAARLAEAKAVGGGVVESAETIAEVAEIIAEVAEMSARSIVEEVGTETASDITKSAIKKEIAKCITAVNRVAEAIRIAKTAAGEEATNVSAARAALAAARVAYTSMSVIFVEAALKEALCRLPENQSGIEYRVAHATLAQFSEAVTKLRETERKVPTKEEAARASRAERGPQAATFSQADTAMFPGV